MAGVMGIRKFAREQQPGKITERVYPPSPELVQLNDLSMSGFDPVMDLPRVIELAQEVERPRVAAAPAGEPLAPQRPSTPRELTITASRAAPVEQAPENLSRALWEIYNRTENPADFVRADEAMMRERVPAKAGGKTAQGRKRETVKSIGKEPEQADGEGWQRALAYLRQYPMRPGEAELRPYNPAPRDMIGGMIAGDDPRSPAGVIRGRLADALVGSTGLEGSGTIGFGALDVAPRVGAALQVGDVGKAMQDEDYLTAGAMAALPAAFAARRQIADAGRRALEVARQYAPQAGATAAVGATMMPQEAEAIVPSRIAAKLGFKPTVGQSEIGRRMVEGTPGASIVDDALRLVLSRNQMPEQAGDLSVRGGAFYLPEGSPNARYYRTGGNPGSWYGGKQPISGETTIYNPLIVKGSTGGKAPEAAYRQLLGKDAFDQMQRDVWHYSMGVPPEAKGEATYRFLSKYASPLADHYQHILDNSRRGNQLRYALQEAAVGQAAREAGHDAIVGYSTRRDKTPFISEVFDLRENRYPSPGGGYSLWPELEEKATRAEGGAVENEPGLVDRALSILSQLNPIGSAEAAPVKSIVRGAAKAIKGAGDAPTAAREPLFDYSGLGNVPHVRQFDLPRYEPARGVPERTQAIISDPNVREKMLRTIEEGEKLGGSRWYNADPLREVFVREYGRERGDEAFRKYMDLVAATSPRSEVGANARNASYYFHRAMTGQGMPEVGERNPQPYGHMAQRLHQMNAQRVAGAGWDPLNNPKPASFVENLVGNQQPVTVDTHAFRLPAIIARDPRFLETAFQVDKTAPKQNIGQMVARGELPIEEAARRPAYWQAQPKENEYAAMERYYKSLGQDLGLTPAQTQAAAWVGGGKLTGLKSDESKPFLQFFEDRIYKTAIEKNMDPQDVLKAFVRGQMPLYASGGSVTDNAIDTAKRIAKKSANIKEPA